VSTEQKPRAVVAVVALVLATSALAAAWISDVQWTEVFVRVIAGFFGGGA
jgi:hypothetical protein